MVKEVRHDMYGRCFLGSFSCTAHVAGGLLGFIRLCFSLSEQRLLFDLLRWQRARALVETGVVTMPRLTHTVGSIALVFGLLLFASFPRIGEVSNMLVQKVCGPQLLSCTPSSVFNRFLNPSRDLKVSTSAGFGPVKTRTVQPMATAAKIQLYSLATPNGQKIGCTLEELGLEYEPHTVNILKGEHFSPEFTAINPNSKIPAIVDPNGPDGKPIRVFESGAILLYLAEKSGKLISQDPQLKWETIQWVFFQVAGVGPMFGQFGHFLKLSKEKMDHPYPLERYSNETKRILGVLEKRLEGRDYLIDDGYSIADIAIWPWVNALSNFYKAGDRLEVDSFKNVQAWVARCAERPASIRGVKVCPWPF